MENNTNTRENNEEVKEVLITKEDKIDLKKRVSKITNTIADILRILSIMVIILGILVVVGQFDNLEDVSNKELIDVVITISTFGGIAFSGFILAEIIQILHDIRYKLYLSKKD